MSIVSQLGHEPVRLPVSLDDVEEGELVQTEEGSILCKSDEEEHGQHWFVLLHESADQGWDASVGTLYRSEDDLEDETCYICPEGLSITLTVCGDD